MKLFTVLENGNPKEEVFTSLLGACNSCGVNYHTASRGKRKFLIDGKFIQITPATLSKIKGRGNKNL